MIKTLLGVVGAFIVVGAGTWYLMQHPVVAPLGEERAVSTEKEAFSGSFADLAARGGNHECTLTTETNGVTTTGTVYVSGNDVRGDFSSVVPQMGAVESHMIADGTTVHAWTSLMKMGYKMAQTKASGTASVAGQSFDMSQMATYECHGWVRDDAKFVIPTDVTFATQ